MMDDRRLNEADEARRRFLANCGKFAVATPPAISLILAEANRNFAFAQSAGPGPAPTTFRANNGIGNGGGDGVPGRSGSSSSPNATEFNSDTNR